MIIILLVLFGSILKAQSISEKINELARNKDYIEAAALISKVVKDNPKDINLLLLCGDIYLELDKIDSARIMYEMADDVKGSVPSTLRKIAKTYSLLGKHNDAIKIVKKAIKESPDDVYNYLALGEVYLKADSMNQATFEIMKARDMDKKIPDADVALGDLYFAQKVYELARSNYESALSKDDKLLDARIKLAITYYNLAIPEQDSNVYNELFTRSLKEWTLVAKQDPKNAKAFYEEAKLLYFSKRYLDAVKPFYEYLALRPDASLARWYLAQSLVETGLCDSAETQLKLVSKAIDSVKNKASLFLARCYFNNKKYTECANEFASLDNIKYDIDDKDLEIYALAVFKNGDTLKSIPIYSRLIDKDPTRCELTYKLGLLLLNIKQYDQSILFFKKRLVNCKDNLYAKCLFFIGNCFFSKDEPDSAMFYLKLSTEKDSSDLFAHLYLGDAYAKLQRNDDSKREFYFVIENTKGDTSANGRSILNNSYYKLAGLIYKEKDYKELQSVTKKWIEYDPNTEFGYLFLAISYQGMEDKETACKYYKKVIQINPKNKPAHDMVKQLQCP